MRLQLLAGSVASLGFLLVAAACTTETIIQTVPGDADAGSSGSSGRSSSGASSSSGTSGGEEEEEEEKPGTSSSGGSSSGNPAQSIKSDPLAQGDVLLLGLAGDDAIYVEFAQAGNTIQAVPIAGGTATKVADLGQGDRPGVAGGAVAIWTGSTAADPRGTLNVWTRATGLKTDVATGSVPGLFAASADGSRIAFSQAATLNGAGDALASTAVGVRDTGAADNAATLTGSTAVNLTTTTCDPDWGFVGKVFIAAHCTGTAGTGATATNAKVLLVPDGATVAASRLDATSLATAGTAQPFWIADSTAAKVLFITNATKQARVKEVGGDTVDIDTEVEQGVLLADGSAVVYRKTSGALVKATTATTPVTTSLADGVKGVLGFSGDQKQVLFHKLDRAGGLADLHVVDHTAGTPAPVTIDATAAVLPAGFTGSSSHVLFLGDVGASGAALKSIPVGGGTAKSVAADLFGARALTEGNGAIFLTNRKVVGQAPNQITLFDLAFVDTVAGSKPAAINDSMPQGEFRLKGKRLVYSKLAQQGSGIYAATLP